MPAQPSTVREDVDYSAEFLVMVGGMVTSVLVVLINAEITKRSGIDFLSVSNWFVVPTGALIGGMGAASGYYFMALWTQAMPSKRFLIEMAAIGGSTWLLAHWIEYNSVAIRPGKMVRDSYSFWDFFKISTEHQSLVFGSGRYSRDATPELGRLGYVRELLQLGGFLVGGLLAFSWLEKRERCNGCRRYAKVKTLLKAAPLEKFDAVIDRAKVAFPGALEQAALESERTVIGMDLMLLKCPQCARQWARPAIVVAAGNRQDRVKLGEYKVVSSEAARLKAAMLALK